METKFIFSDERIAALRPGDKRYTVQDAKTPGLFLRVEPAGKPWAKNGRTYWLRIWHNGRERTKKLGTWPHMTVKMARAEYQTARSAMGANGDAAKETSTKQVRLEAVWEQYAALNPDGQGEATRTNRNYFFKKHVKKPLGNLFLQEVRPRDVEAVKCAMAADGLSPSTINELRFLLSLLYKWAVRMEMLPARFPCPTESLVWPALPPGRTRRLHADETPAFFAALEEYSKRKHPSLTPGYHQTVADALLVLMFTGARSRNVKRMEWTEVNLERGVWTVPRSKTKTKSEYSVAITSQVKEILERRHAGPAGLGRYVFPGRGDAPMLASLRRSFRTICNMAGVDNFTIHDLRRNQGSVQADLDINLALIGKSLCHSDIKSTAVYVHARDIDQIRGNMERANRAMLGQRAPDELALTPEDWEEIIRALGARPLAEKVRRLVDITKVA